MKLRIGLFSLFVCLLLLPASIAVASGVEAPVLALEAGLYDEEDHSEHDDHHGAQPFTLRTLLPLVAGFVGAVVAAGLAKGLSFAVKPLELGIVGLTTVTGVLHLVLGLAGDKLLFLNGLGYLGLLGLIYLPLKFLSKLQLPLRIVLGLYTFVTIAGYFWLHSPAHYDVLAILSKVIEVILLVLIARSIFKTPQVQPAVA